MNNSQFRKLVLDTPARQSSANSKGKNSTTGPAATPSLGSRARSSIPMTPRSIVGYSSSNDFARQLAERNNPSSTTQKKFKSIATPKGAKLPEGYVDRAKAREGDGEESDKVKRIKALEEMMKLGQMDQESFEKVREDILGDDIGDRVGLVKGLDFKMLERVRKGEIGVMDVLEGGKGKDTEGEDDDDVDDEFDELEDREVTAIVKEKVAKRGEMAPPSLTGKKRNRDQILAELKAARLAAKEAAQPSLGSKFKKVGEKRTESRIERDSKGREVLITTDEHGNEKRKVRKAPPPKEPEEKDLSHLLMPDKDAKPLGMEVPEILKTEEEEEEINIFDDAGDDYNPLAGLEDDDSHSEKEDEGKEDGEVEESPKPKEKPEPEKGQMLPPPKPSQSRNYFGGTKHTPAIDPSKSSALSDPTILAALKKASTLNPISLSTSAEEKAKEEKRRKMLQQDDRDAQDMDMGFGSSRFDDQEDGEDGGSKRVKLSEWGAEDSGEEGGRSKGGKKERKRGGKQKKRKGDGESAKDVLGVLERRKAERD